MSGSSSRPVAKTLIIHPEWPDPDRWEMLTDAGGNILELHCASQDVADRATKFLAGADWGYGPPKFMHYNADEEMWVVDS